MSWMNVARALKVVALVLFFAPWLVVSCNGSPLVEASGVELITGDIEPPPGSPLGAMIELDRAGADEAASAEQAQANAGGGVIDDARWWVVLGALLIVAGLVLGVVLRPLKTGALAALGATGLALAVLGGGMAWTVNRFESELRQATESAPQTGDAMEAFGRNMAAAVSAAIQLDVQAGYWLCLTALGLAAVAGVLAAGGAGRISLTVGPRDG